MFFIQCVIAATNIVAAVLLTRGAPVAEVAPRLVVAYACSYAVGGALSYALLCREVGGLEGAVLVRFLVRLAIAVGVERRARLGSPRAARRARRRGRGRLHAVAGPRGRGGALHGGLPRAGPAAANHRGHRRRGARHAPSPQVVTPLTAGPTHAARPTMGTGVPRQRREFRDDRLDRTRHRARRPLPARGPARRERRRPALASHRHGARTQRRDPRVTSDDPRSAALLEAARVSATVTDPHLLRVLDCDDSGGITWVVNEWGDGVSLDLMLQQGTLPPSRAAWLAREVADAIAAGHAAGVAHGRLNPEAVLVTHAGAVKLIGYVVDASLEPPRPPDPLYGDSTTARPTSSTSPASSTPP